MIVAGKGCWLWLVFLVFINSGSLADSRTYVEEQAEGVPPATAFEGLFSSQSPRFSGADAFFQNMFSSESQKPLDRESRLHRTFAEVEISQSLRAVINRGAADRQAYFEYLNQDFAGFSEVALNPEEGLYQLLLRWMQPDRSAQRDRQIPEQVAHRTALEITNQRFLYHRSTTYENIQVWATQGDPSFYDYELRRQSSFRAENALEFYNATVFRLMQQERRQSVRDQVSVEALRQKALQTLRLLRAQNLRAQLSRGQKFFGSESGPKVAFDGRAVNLYDLLDLSDISYSEHPLFEVIVDVDIPDQAAEVGHANHWMNRDSALAEEYYRRVHLPTPDRGSKANFSIKGGRGLSLHAEGLDNIFRSLRPEKVLNSEDFDRVSARYLIEGDKRELHLGALYLWVKGLRAHSPEDFLQKLRGREQRLQPAEEGVKSVLTLTHFLRKKGYRENHLLSSLWWSGSIFSTEHWALRDEFARRQGHPTIEYSTENRIWTFHENETPTVRAGERPLTANRAQAIENHRNSSAEERRSDVLRGGRMRTGLAAAALVAGTLSYSAATEHLPNQIPQIPGLHQLAELLLKPAAGIVEPLIKLFDFQPDKTEVPLPEPSQPAPKDPWIRPERARVFGEDQPDAPVSDSSEDQVSPDETLPEASEPLQLSEELIRWREMLRLNQEQFLKFFAEAQNNNPQLKRMFDARGQSRNPQPIPGAEPMQLIRILLDLTDLQSRTSFDDGLEQLNRVIGRAVDTSGLQPQDRLDLFLQGLEAYFAKSADQGRSLDKEMLLGRLGPDREWLSYLTADEHKRAMSQFTQAMTFLDWGLIEREMRRIKTQRKTNANQTCRELAVGLAAK